MKRLVWLFLFAGLFLYGCSSYNYYSVNNSRVNLSKYKTFAWISGEAKKSQFYDNDIAEDKIITSATSELEKRGYGLDNKKPDLLIRYSAVVNDKTRTYNQPMYYQAPSRLVPSVGFYRGRTFYYYRYTWPFPVYVGSEQRKVEVKEGNIIFDVIDRRTSKVIWRGWVEGEVNNPEKALADIPKVIQKIFTKYPLV